MNKKELAIKEYEELHKKSPTVYHYWADRIKELDNKDSQQFTELVNKQKKKNLYFTQTRRPPIPMDWMLEDLKLNKKKTTKRQLLHWGATAFSQDCYMLC